MTSLLKRGLTEYQADEVWYQLQGFCMRRMAEEDEGAPYAALVFDGDGGDVIGVAPEGYEGGYYSDEEEDEWD